MFFREIFFGYGNRNSIFMKNTSVDKKTGPHRAFRYYWLKLRRLQGNPFILARGIGIGAFVGVTPTIPFHTGLTIFLCTIFKGNIVAAIIANWIVSNPVTIPVEYYLAWKIGTWLTSIQISWDQVCLMLQQLQQAQFSDAFRLLFIKFSKIMYCLIAGGIVLAVPVGILCYFLSLYLYLLRQKRRQQKFLRKK